MIEKLLASVLAQPAFSRLAREELERLREGGYLPEGEAQDLLKQAQERLAEGAAQASLVAGPIVSGLTRSVREALDLPSRAEIVALTEALRAQQARDSQPEADAEGSTAEA